jgi:hypothetical protein
LRTTASIAAAVMLGALTIQPLASAEAAKPVRFTFAQYDPAGSDNGENWHVNKEWISVKNFSNRTKNLSGWTIRDEAGYRYRFPRGFKLRPGKSVALHTGRGDSGRAHRFWGHGFYVWNNTGDKATLKNARGRVIDRCSWGDGDGTTGC